MKFFRKKKKNEDRKPLNLPEISKSDLDPIEIKNILNQGTPIWAWYSLEKDQSLDTLATLTNGYLDGFRMIRKEHDLLVVYRAEFYSGEMFLKLEDVYEFKATNVQEIYSTILCRCYKVYYDPENLTTETQAFVHDLSVEFLHEQLAKNYVYHVTDDHFLNKEN